LVVGVLGLSRPAAVQAFPDALEHEQFVVAGEDEVGHGHGEVEAGGGVGTAGGEVAEAPDAFDPGSVELGAHRLQRIQVAVHVCEHSDPRASTVRPTTTPSTDRPRGDFALAWPRHGCPGLHARLPPSTGNEASHRDGSVDDRQLLDAVEQARELHADVVVIVANLERRLDERAMQENAAAAPW
jgi:hypothetical protein